MSIIPYDKEILPVEEAEKLPYYKELVHIKRLLKENISSKACCCVATKITHIHLGLEELAGDYIAKNRYLSKRLERRFWFHSWNYDPERDLYVDITQDQFLETLPDIVILPDTTEILVPSESETEQLISGDIFHRDLVQLILRKLCGN